MLFEPSARLAHRPDNELVGVACSVDFKIQVIHPHPGLGAVRPRVMAVNDFAVPAFQAEIDKFAILRQLNRFEVPARAEWALADQRFFPGVLIGKRARRLAPGERFAVQTSSGKVDARVSFILLMRSGLAQIVAGQILDIFLLPEHFAQPALAHHVPLMPERVDFLSVLYRMVVPMLWASGAGVFMPQHAALRMVKIVTEGEGADAEADFITGEVKLRIVAVFLAVPAHGEEKMAGHKAGAEWALEVPPAFDCAGTKQNGSATCEAFRHHLVGGVIVLFVGARIVAAGVRSHYRFWTAGLLQHLNQTRIPMRSETMMGVNLQGEGFAGVEPLQPPSSPAQTFALLPGDFVNDKLFVSFELSERCVARVLLPANAEAQFFGVLGLRQAITDCR